MSHCKAIVFSEEVAVEGISEEIYSLINNVNIRPDTSVIVSKCNAKDFIESTEPDLENAVSQYYEITPKSNQNTGFTDFITIGKFYNSLISDTSEACAILGSLNDNEDSNSSASGESGGSSDSSGGTSYKGKPGTETIGLAIFKGDRLIGETSSIESICHLIITNNLTSCTISVSDPTDNKHTIDLNIYKNKPTKIKVDIVNGAPYVTVDCNLNARILSVDENSNYTSKEKIEVIGEAANNYLKNNISNYLFRTSKEFKSDISGIGKYAIKNFVTISEWQNYNWLANYENAFFNINVNTVVKSGYLLTET